ncbi:MAG: hypothetical protein IPQ07_41545 [Myxococcales bacterium]|nr:hypothetical protein [Myxococcales bacterium]
MLPRGTRAALVIVGLAHAIACSDGPPEPGPDGWAWTEPPTSSVPEPGVRLDVIRVPVAAAPPNPMGGGAAPAELDVVTVLRFRIDAPDPVPVQAIVVAMPGFLSGGHGYALLARALVRRGAAAGRPIEVWAIDRRANNLEDLRGFQAARELDYPAVANDYYFNDVAVAGQRFAGTRNQADVPWLSEWGLAVHADDLRTVIAKVAPSERKARVVLLGHSLGASFAEAYAAWRFSDGVRGFDELAGLVLLDGGLGSEPITQAQYETEGTGSGLMAGPSLAAIRKTTRYSELPFLGVSVFVRSEILAQRAHVDPGGVEVDGDRDATLRLLLSLPAVPKVTNRAALAFAFDRSFDPLGFVTTTLGRPTGGPVEMYTNTIFGGTFSRPTDVDATYDWDTGPSSGARTSLAAFADAYSGVWSNFVEWYFPARLPLDLAACGDAHLDPTSWQATAGLRAFDGLANDAPVLSVAAGLVSVQGMAAIAGRIAPVVGPGRPAAGAARTTAQGLEVIDATALSHVDVIAAPAEENPAIEAIEGFLERNIPATRFAAPVL